MIRRLEERARTLLRGTTYDELYVDVLAAAHRPVVGLRASARRARLIPRLLSGRMADEPALVRVERRADGVAVVTLDNPKVNALSSALLTQLKAVAEDLHAEPSGRGRDHGRRPGVRRGCGHLRVRRAA